MKINQKILPKKYNDILYANDFKCKNLISGFMPGKFYNWTNNTWENNNSFGTSNLIDIEQDTYYVFSHEMGSIGGAVVCFDGSDNYVSVMNNDTITTPFKITNSNVKKIRVIAYDGLGDFASHEHWMQLEKGTTPTSFTPFKPGIEEIYSTEEIRIGTWIDGKPLYRKVISNWVVPSHNSSISTTIGYLPNISNIVNLYGCYVDEGGATRIVGQISPNGSEISRLLHLSSNGAILFEMSAFGANVSLTATLEYTKTTD